MIANVIHYCLFSTAGDPFAQVEEFTVCDPDLTAYAMFNLHWVILAANETAHEQVNRFIFVKWNVYTDVHREIVVYICKYLSHLFNTLILVCLILHTRSWLW